MKKGLLLVLIIILIIFLYTGCTKETNPEQVTELTDNNREELNNESKESSKKVEQLTKEVVEDVQSKQINSEKDLKYYLSPFTGQPINKRILKKVIMVSIENSPRARPQSGLEEAAIVYEFLVEGGITRFLALYWNEIPEKVGPIRSVRPYLIETALEYNALLLHAGASPEGFDLLARSSIDHLDQIFKGNYYWRSSQRRAPHNLYTGNFKINSYLNKLTGQEYKTRFSFQQVSFIQPDEPKANKIDINYWGGNRVSYQFDGDKNIYYRYLSDLDTPHLAANGEQLTAKNIIIQYVSTKVIDHEGRLQMELKGKGKTLIFRDGIVINGFWQKNNDRWTEFYNEQGEMVQLNPGQTWIQIVPDFLPIKFEE